MQLRTLIQHWMAVRDGVNSPWSERAEAKKFKEAESERKSEAECKSEAE